MLAWLAPLLVFGLVIFVHELGHFLAAKWAGVYAPRFSIGFGPALWRRRRGETEYIVAAVPLGGYVRMASKEDEATAFLEGGSEIPADTAAAAPVHETAGGVATARGPHDPRSPTVEPPAGRPRDWDENAMMPFGPRRIPPDRWFESKPLWKRLVIMLAGVTMNVLLAWIVTVGTFAAYGRAHLPAVVDSTVAGRPAAAAGFRTGDTIVAIAGERIRDWPHAVERISASPGVPLTVEVARGTRLELVVTPAPDTATNLFTGRTEHVGRVGMTPRAEIARIPVGPLEAMTSGTRATVFMAGAIVQVVRGLVTGHVGVETLGGPVAIAQVSVEAGRAGFEPLLALIAFISINLAVLNLLPIPVLDGGNILIMLVEAVKGKPLTARTREWVLRAGLALILLLIITVMYNDLARLGRSIFER